MIIDNYDLYINNIRQTHNLIITKKIEMFEDSELEYFTCFVTNLIDEIHNYCLELKDFNLIEKKYINTLENNISEFIMPLFAKEVSGKEINKKTIKRKALHILIVLSCYISPLLLRYFLKIYLKEYNNDLSLLFKEDKNNINIIMYCCNTLENISELLTIIEKKYIFMTNKNNISPFLLLVYNGLIQQLLNKKIVDLEDFINFSNNNFNVYHVFALLSSGKVNFYNVIINHKITKKLMYQKDKNNNIPLILAIKYNNYFAEDIIKSDLFDLEMLEIMITNYNLYLYEYMELIFNKKILTEEFIERKQEWFRNFFIKNNFNKINIDKQILNKYVFSNLELIKQLIQTNIDKFKSYVNYYNEISKTIFYSKDQNLIKSLITNCPLIAYNMILDNKEYLYANNIVYNDIEILKTCLIKYEVSYNIKNLTDIDDISKVIEEIVAYSKFTINEYKENIETLNISVIVYILTKLNKIYNLHIAKQNLDMKLFVNNIQDIIFDTNTTINVIDILINSNIIQNNSDSITTTLSINKLINLCNLNMNNAKYILNNFKKLFIKESDIELFLNKIQHINNIKIFEYILKSDIIDTSVINKISIYPEANELVYLIHKLSNSEQIKCLLKSRPDFKLENIYQPNILIVYLKKNKFELLKTVLLLEEIHFSKKYLKEGFTELLKEHVNIEENILTDLIDVYIKLYDSLDLINNLETMNVLFKLRHKRLRDIIFELEDKDFKIEYFKMAIDNNICINDIVSRNKFTYKIVKQLNIDLHKLVFNFPIPKIFDMAISQNIIVLEDLFKPLDNLNPINICYKLIAYNNYDYLINLAIYFKNNYILIQNGSNSPLTYMIDKIDVERLKFINITKKEIIDCKLIENLLKKNSYDSFIKLVELYNFNYDELKILKIENEDIFLFINENNVHILENIKEDVFIDYLHKYNIGCLTSSRMKKYLLEDKINLNILNKYCKNNLTLFEILINYTDEEYIKLLINKIIDKKIKLKSGLYFFLLHYYDLVNLDIFYDIENQIKYLVKYCKDYLNIQLFYDKIIHKHNYILCLIYYLSIYEPKYIYKFFLDYPELIDLLTEKYNNKYLIFQCLEVLDLCNLDNIINLKNNNNQSILHLNERICNNIFILVLEKLENNLFEKILEKDNFNKNVIDYIFINKNYEKLKYILEKLTEQEIKLLLLKKINNNSFDTYAKYIIENYSKLDFDLLNLMKNNLDLIINKNNDDITNLFYLIKYNEENIFNMIINYVADNHLEYYFINYDNNLFNGFMYAIKYNQKTAEYLLNKINNNHIKYFTDTKWLELCILENPNLITKIAEKLDSISEDIMYDIMLIRIKDNFLEKITYMNCLQYASKNNANSLDKLMKLKNKNILINKLLLEITELDEQLLEEKELNLNDFNYENKYNCFKLAVLYNSDSIDVIVNSPFYTDNIILNTDKMMKNTCINDAFYMNISSCFKMLTNNKIKLNFIHENKQLNNDITKYFGYKNIDTIMKANIILKHNDIIVSDEDNDVCHICYMHKCQITFIPCQHHTCVTCSCKVNKCHICRAEITNRVYIYK